MGKFAENMKKIRQDMKMSQEDFAQLLHTSKQNISRYEAGTVSPKISTAAKIAEILGISLSELNGEEGKDESVTDQELAAFAQDFARLPEEKQKQVLDYMKFLLSQHE